MDNFAEELKVESVNTQPLSRGAWRESYLLNKLDLGVALMETLGDLIRGLREISRAEPESDDVERVFGWRPESIRLLAPSEDESIMHIVFEKGVVLEVRYFLNDSLIALGDDMEMRLMLQVDITSRVGYNVFYSKYIHGQGYIRVSLRDVENKMVQKILEDYYLPRLRSIFKPVIIEFRGFSDRDFFGVEAGREHGYIYYSPVRPKSGENEVKIIDVISRLYHLDSLLRNRDIPHQLAELELQMSFLPSVMWM
ncbi:MAG: hypothetical protein NQU42_01285 [Methanothrix sp.]|uniref:hypothetical protein n=1 Tax=Methanothrix sp. TaxID=90426 RepID=UPI0025FCBEDD|nr:hypothetical protein [Methanothrix sp.]MCQ8902720.1 hypothetical protein [Methanothrix sp.]